jgi:glycosyltransferase involved in cell wall biosynthesis
MSLNSEMLTLVIPCFNEEENLPELIESCSQYIATTGTKFIFVNNGSGDNSRVYLNSVSHPEISVVNIEINEGYGNGVWQGVKSANTELIGWMHADQAKLLGNLNLDINSFLGRNAFYKGFRIGRTKREEIISFSMSIICSIILRTRLREINAQPSIYPRSLLSQIEKPPKDFSFDMYIYFKAVNKGLKENRIGVHMPLRTKGTSSWNTGNSAIIKMSLRTICATIQLKRGS